MAKRTTKREDLRVEFIGKNAEEVTGSMTLVRDRGLTILLEAGLYQNNNLEEEYRANSRKLDINMKKVDYIILGHIHADHAMLIPRLVAEGCRARIIVPKNTRGSFKISALDSAYIIDRNCSVLEKRKNKAYHRIYNRGHVFETLQYMEEYNYGEKVELDNRLTVRFTPSGHVPNAAQIELWVKNEQCTKTSKILCTSDLGNVGIKKNYVKPFERVEKANIVIGECTYSEKGRQVQPEMREKDRERLYHELKTTKGILEIPVFAYDRCATLLTEIYELVGKDPTYKTDVVVDSTMAVNELRLGLEEYEGEDKEKLAEVLRWKNVKLLKEGEESKEYMKTVKRCVVLTASGMLCNGRSKIWLKKIIGGEANTLLFVGYASETTLAGQIKQGKEVLKIDNVPYENRCRVVDLKSYTSHMQYPDLLNYYSSIQADKICLVHGNKVGKQEFAEVLQKEIRKKQGRAKVVVVTDKMKIKI